MTQQYIDPDQLNDASGGDSWRVVQVADLLVLMVLWQRHFGYRSRIYIANSCVYTSDGDAKRNELKGSVSVDSAS